MSPELNRGGKLPALLVSLANRRGFRLIDHKHMESMESRPESNKQIHRVRGPSARNTQDVVQCSGA